MVDDRSDALALLGVSRETAERLDRFAALLQKWQSTKNLIAPATLSQLWMRHIADSGQLLRFGKPEDVWVDLGAGAGFPGLVLATMMVERGAGEVHLIESRSGKAAFLREAVRVTGARAQVYCGRLEDVLPSLAVSVDLVTARALAPMATLLDWTAPLIESGARGLFLKGEEFEVELTQAPNSSRFTITRHASLTSKRGVIVEVTAQPE